MADYSIYKHTLPKEISGKNNDMFYIGITMQDVKKRWANGHGYKSTPRFYNAIQKYGWNNFSHEILFEDLTKEEAERREIELIAYYKSNQRDFGYNISNGGECIGKHSEETKQKMKENHADFSGENHPLYGKHHSNETKLTLSQKAKERYEKHGHPCEGKICSIETKMLLSDIAKKRLSNPENNPFYNRHHTQETKNILSEKAKERFKERTKHPSYGKTKKVINLDDGVVYPSVQYVSEKFGLSMAALYRNCTGKNDRCGGHRFRYLDLVEGAVS
jgi:group I intron endonuclease